MPDTRKTSVMNVKDYPELEGLEVGSSVKGSWEGSIASVDGDDYTVSYDTVNIETENEADRSLQKLTGKKKEKKMPMPPMEEEEY